MSVEAIITRHVSGHITFQGTADDHARWMAQEDALRSAAKSDTERTTPSGNRR